MPHRPFRLALPLVSVAALVAAGAVVPAAKTWALLAWNDLGMHCLDPDYAVFSILPPFNDLHAQLVDPQGHLATPASGVVLTYEAVADPGGSVNASSIGKTDFWDHVQDLFGVSLAPDAGLAGHDMPGPANVPQPMTWDSALASWTANGLPITPWDDAGHHRTYPLMRVVARNSKGQLLATADAVLPVSDELDCAACHASGAGPAAEPAGGWVGDGNADRDHRLNILRLHDERQAASGLYAAALAAQGFSIGGLEATVVQDGRAILCAACHASNALGAPGYAGVGSLTAAVHAHHANVTDPTSGMTLEDSDNRSACYRCHPGSETRCLRGAMGAAVAADGSLAIQCQSCHGPLSAVGDPGREGWLDEPNCQACHTGTATHNNGQIRYTDALVDGVLRVAVDATFATNPDVPGPGLSLYKLSQGHGDLRCEACHGSTHAEYPGSHPNDNLLSVGVQGHVGLVGECAACHGGAPKTVTGGPHGMHPVGPAWVDRHAEEAEGGGEEAASGCADCHGADFRGTVLSRMFSDRKLAGREFFKGQTVSCFICHPGPEGEGPVKNTRPVAQDATAASAGGDAAVVTLVATDADGDPLAWRIVRQPAHGRVALSGQVATYLPDPGFAGDDPFTFTASDGQVEALPGTVTVQRAPEWSLYGDGYPGSGGLVPSIALVGTPTWGAVIEVSVDNPLAQTAPAWLFVSSEASRRPTAVGARLFVEPTLALQHSLAPGDALVTERLPLAPAFAGQGLNLQVALEDPGALHGWAFTRALRVTPGP